MENVPIKKVPLYGRLADRLSTLLFYASIILFLAAFNFRDNPGGWQLQYLPNLNGQSISDVIFLDSLTGIFTTNANVAYDSSYIYKTTNGGNNWTMKYKQRGGFSRVIFVDAVIGYTCGGTNSGTAQLYKTTDRGETWNQTYAPSTNFWNDMSILNKDTMWLVDGNGLLGGVFRTTNGGQNWIQQFAQFSQNPDKIYMVNKNLGFIRNGFSGAYIGRTTNGGFNWTLTNVDSSFYDMHFSDSLNGWMAGIVVKKTTNGGLNWSYQSLPNIQGSIYYIKAMLDFSFVNKDTAFGVGGWFDYPNNQTRGVIYKTTNGGVNWGYQIPDTSFGITQLHLINFVDKLKGSAYKKNGSSIKTVSGGSDTTFYTAVNSHEIRIFQDFVLYQNYPNPFNQSTIIKYEIQKPGYVAIKVYDVTGKEIRTLLSQRKTAGSYSVTFDAGGLSSGVYFYKFTYNSPESERSEIKKMLYIK